MYVLIDAWTFLIQRKCAIKYVLCILTNDGNGLPTQLINFEPDSLTTYIGCSTGQKQNVTLHTSVAAHAQLSQLTDVRQHRKTIYPH